MSRRRPRPPRPCHTPGKQLYVSRAAAETAARTAADAFGGQFHAYRCPCSWWHLTTHPQEVNA